MITCMKSYACICENLECNPSNEAKEALAVLIQFKTIFEDADAAIQAPVLQEICRDLAYLHFKEPYSLDTKPVDTIRREYKKRTGNDLSPYFCSIAYQNFRETDAQTRRKVCILDAESEQQNLIQRLREKTEQNRSKGGN